MHSEEEMPSELQSTSVPKGIKNKNNHYEYVAFFTLIISTLDFTQKNVYHIVVD